MQARHILPLTGIRLCAAAWVVLFHAKPVFFTLCPFLLPLNNFFDLGYEAVPFFFLLSGFILSHNYFPGYSLGQHPRFLFLRFARIWPVHFVTLFLFILGPVLLQFQWAQMKSFLEEMAMIRPWWHDEFAWNYPAWSISVEFFAYIFIFPLAFILFRRIQSLPVLIVLVILLLCGQSFLPIERLPGKCATIPLLFLAGSGLYRIHCVLKNPPAQAMQICGTLLFLAYVCFSHRLSFFILLAAFALVLLGLASQTGFLARLLSTKFFVHGGLASYSLYMTHALVLRSYFFFSWENLPQSAILRSVIAVILMAGLAGAALISYHYLEEPANRALRRLYARHNPKPIA
jgi:peptidoglycan/LPS O-acetylase OafA/YrhL